MSKNIIETMVFNKKEFKEAMEIITGTAQDEARPILQCLHFERNNIVALDGYRLMIRKNNNILNGVYNIHRDYIKIMINTVKQYKDNIEKISLNFNYNDTATLNINDVEVYSCDLSIGNYPEYNILLPEEFKTIVNIEPKAIKDTIKPLRKNKMVLLNINNDIFNIKDVEDVKNKNGYRQYTNIIGSNIDNDIKCMKNGDDIEIAFNHTYIKEALNHYNNKKKIDIKLNDRLAGVLITDNENRIDFILPIRYIKSI